MASNFRSLLQFHRALHPHCGYYINVQRKAVISGRIALQSWQSRRTLVVQQVGPQMPQPPNEADGQQPRPPHHGPMGETERAEGMCDLARTEYAGRIDGILRMEGGFEIILCDFEKDLDLVQIAQTRDGDTRGGGGGGPSARGGRR